MKEQDKNSEEKVSEVEISNLPDNEFKLGRRMDEHRNLARS